MGRQLASFDDITYTYDESGIRTSKTSNGVTTKYYLNGTNIIEQTDGTTTLHFYYDSNDELIGFNYADNDYFYVKNQQGDITDIVDTDGNVVASYAYDPWGKVVSVTGSNTAIGNINPFRYRSYYYDTDIQMYYLQSRYYDAGVGRFINCDDVHYIGESKTEISYNLFAYCENNPINDQDSEGFININAILKMLKRLIKIARSFDEFHDKIYKYVEIEKDNREYTDSKGKIKTPKEKFQILVDFSKHLDFWKAAWKMDDCKDFIDYVADVALEKFKKKQDRDFLLDKRCVSNEIYQHLYGYMWSIGVAKTCPVQFYGYYILKGTLSTNVIRKKVKDATEAANIFEADMFLHKEEATWYGFNYYDGIASCYKNTKADPYYNPKTKERNKNYLRAGWLDEKIKK